MNITIGTCRERVAYWEHVDSVLAARHYAASQNIATGMNVASPTYIHLGRQQIVDMFLEDKDATHLCFVDSDNTLPREAFWALAQRGMPIVGALYFARRGLPAAVANNFVDDKYNSRSASKAIRQMILSNELPVVNRPQYIEGAPTLKVDVIGFGCTLIKREVIEAIVQKYTNAFGGHGHDVGEDIVFCSLAKGLGYDVYVDLGVQLGHLATCQITAADFMSVQWVEEG